MCLRALACVLHILTSFASTVMEHTHVLCSETFASRQANKKKVLVSGRSKNFTVHIVNKKKVNFTCQQQHSVLRKYISYMPVKLQPYAQNNNSGACTLSG